MIAHELPTEAFEWRIRTDFGALEGKGAGGRWLRIVFDTRTVPPKHKANEEFSPTPSL